jgi:hypothetical protein
MTHAMTLAADFQDLAQLQKSTLNLRNAGRRAFLVRMTRLDAKQRESRATDASATLAHLDLELLKAREALDNAWAVEVEKMILMKRTGTSQASADFEAAKTATKQIALRIEMLHASTPDGFKVKARAALWRSNGEPLSAKKSRGSLRDRLSARQCDA